jgi:tRNA G37 N-methylase Trm5
LNGFAGVGGTAIKLASINSCAKVIANDYNGKKTKILLNNAKVYEVDGSIELN